MTIDNFLEARDQLGPLDKSELAPAIISTLFGLLDSQFPELSAKFELAHRWVIENGCEKFKEALDKRNIVLDVGELDYD